MDAAAIVSVGLSSVLTREGKQIGVLLTCRLLELLEKIHAVGRNKCYIYLASHGSVVKNCLPVQETQEMWVRSLGQEEPLKEEMATHCSILA